MKRRFAALVACALMAFGQRSSPPAAAPVPLVVDAVAVDASGRAVADLTAGDFEVTQGGSARKITSFTWFDTRLHTAISPAGQLPALDLLPDEIRRNLVVVVDDLGLTPAGVDAVRRALQAFVGSGMSSGDRLAILRTSGGSGVLEQLTGDTVTLANAIQSISYLGGGTGVASASKANWLTLRYALDGLRDFRGRKVVVLFAENPEVTGLSNRGVEDAAYAAHAAGAAVYALHPLHPLPETPGGSAVAPPAMESFTRATGGGFGGEFARVLQNEQGYYAIGFQPEENSIDSTGRSSPPTPAVVKVRRPGVVVRARAGYIRLPPRVESLAPAEYAVLFNTALRSPFGGSDVPTRLTALFADYPPQGPEVEAVVHFEPRDLTFVHDLEDLYRGAVRLRLAAYRDDGLTTLPLEREFKFAMRSAEYRNGIEHGLHFSFQVRLPGPGVWQIRAVVADGASDRIGSATRFVEVPSVSQGGLALTGLALGGGLATAESAAENSQDDPGVRIFKRGQNCTFRYGVFNALTGTDKQSTLEVVTRIFAGGHVVYESNVGRVAYSGMPAGLRRMIRGELRLDARMVPGDFVLQVTVRDTLAPPGQVRAATVFTDFQIRE